MQAVVPPASAQPLAEIMIQASRLNAECRYGDADALMWEAYEARNNAPAALAYHLTLARERDDWFGVVERARLMRQRLPHNPGGYLKALEAHRVLRQFERTRELLTEALARFSGGPLFLKEEVFLAEAHGDWKTADARLAALREALPAEPDTWIESAQSLLRSGRNAAAEALVGDALALFDGNPQLHELHVTATERQGRWGEADLRWTLLIEKFPDSAGIALGRSLIWTRCPRAQRNWTETFARLEQLNSRFPQFVPGYEVHIRFLREVARLADAEALARQAVDQFPLNAATLIEHARVMNADGRQEDALSGLQDAKIRMPFSPSLHAEFAGTLKEAGRLDEAEVVCRDTCQRFRYHPRPFVEYAEVAMRRGDAAACFARWLDGATRFPQHDMFAAGLTAAQLTMIAAGQAEPGMALPTEAELPDGSSLKGLLLGFESLGGPGAGCELGFVQRRVGAEPLGLLRWAEIFAGDLADALEARFDRVGTPEQTDLVLHQEIGDHTIVDRRFRIRMHSFARHKNKSVDDVLQDVYPRLQFLKTKLLRDLEVGKKIFVFRLGTPAVDLDEIERIFAAFQSVSNGMLLCVRSATAGSSDLGSVRVIKRNLLLAYAEEIPSWGLTNHATWHDICRKARALYADGGA